MLRLAQHALANLNSDIAAGIATPPNAGSDQECSVPSIAQPKSVGA